MTDRFDTFSPPPGSWGEPDLSQVVAVVEDDGDLDPMAAAALLERTTHEAERRFDVRPTGLMLAAAVTVLVSYGAVWISVRNQHPYTGPSGTALAVLYGTLAVWIVLVATVQRRALSGRSSRQRRIEAVAFIPIWICVYVFQGALHHAGASDSIAFGVYPAAAPLVIVGSAAAAYESARGRLASAAFAGAVVALGAVGSFAGPRAVWGVIGIGLCALLLVGAAAQVRERRMRTDG